MPFIVPLLVTVDMPVLLVLVMLIAAPRLPSIIPPALLARVFTVSARTPSRPPVISPPVLVKRSIACVVDTASPALVPVEIILPPALLVNSFILPARTAAFVPPRIEPLLVRLVRVLLL